MQYCRRFKISTRPSWSGISSLPSSLFHSLDFSSVYPPLSFLPFSPSSYSFVLHHLFLLFLIMECNFVDVLTDKLIHLYQVYPHFLCTYFFSFSSVNPSSFFPISILIHYLSFISSVLCHGMQFCRRVKSSTHSSWLGIFSLPCYLLHCLDFSSVYPPTFFPVCLPIHSLFFIINFFRSLS